jgi:hypothetical protein
VITSELDHASESDSDLAIPIIDGNDVSGRSVLGVIALDGVDPTKLKPADLRDLSVIAQWLAPTLEGSMHAARRRTATGRIRP